MPESTRIVESASQPMLGTAGKLAFPRAARLLRGADYSRVFAKPKRSRDALFTVLARCRGGAPARLGLAVSRKAARKAVDRNRIKRLVREGFRHNREALNGLDVVVVARPGVARYGKEDLHESLCGHWLRLQKMHARTSAGPAPRRSRGESG